MPSYTHDSLVRLITTSPRLLPQLLRRWLGVSVPSSFELSPGPQVVRPATHNDYTADGTLILRNPKTNDRTAFILEVQLRPDPDKHYSWPLYVSSLRVELQCPVTLVVVTPDQPTANWAARPIPLGEGNSALCPLVVGPSLVPRALDPQTIADSPALGVLAIIMHGHGPNAVPLAKQALEAADELSRSDLNRARLYGDLILGFLSDEALNALRDSMEPDTHGYISEFARRYVQQGHEEGREQGREQGREEGREQGREEGREEGRLAGCVNSLRLILRARKWVLSPALEQRVAECSDVAQIERWIERAASAPDVESIFG